MTDVVKLNRKKVDMVHKRLEYFVVFHCQKNNKSSCDTNWTPVNSERGTFIKCNLSKKLTKGP